MWLAAALSDRWSKPSERADLHNYFRGTFAAAARCGSACLDLSPTVYLSYYSYTIRTARGIPGNELSLHGWRASVFSMLSSSPPRANRYGAILHVPASKK